MEKHYTSEENIQILISLLKEHNIKKIIASPGAMNIGFVASVQNDDFFEIYSCVDERSAGYLACGLAEESKEPVVLTCTGATASRNYFAALTEAYYRKLPIIAVTSTAHCGRIGQGFPQITDRTIQPKDIVKLSVQLPTVESAEDRWACNLNVNKALLEVRHRGYGPVHINVATYSSYDFSVKELPKQRVIKRIENLNMLPKIVAPKIAIFIGAHSKINKELEEEIEEFCEKYNAVVLEDRTGNYFGKYKILPNILCDQDEYFSSLQNVDLVIEIGNISGAYIKIKPKEVWRVNPDGEIRDKYKKLVYIFESEELKFFKEYNKLITEKKETTYYNEWKEECDSIKRKIEDSKIPFSNIWIAKNTINRLPEKCTLHLGILNSLRSWNYFDDEKNIYGYCNTGGFGIDGIVSTIVGASYANKNKIIYGVLGDLAFFYDMNALGIRDIGNNIRIMIINNGAGTEFHNYNHGATIVGNKTGEDVGKFFAADGHFGNKSPKLIKNYAEDLGFKYISAKNKQEYLKNVNEFINERSDKSIVFEVFTNTEDESNALKYIRNLKKNLKASSKNVLKKALGEKNIRTLKNIMKS